MCNIINEEFDKKDNFFFNVKYEFFQYLKNRDKMYDWYVSTNMLTYDCPCPIPPKKQVEGSLIVASMEDYEVAKMLIDGVFDATSEKKISEEECNTITKSRIASGSLYLWKNGTGNAVAMCYADCGTEFGKVTLVYTIPTQRRKGYAARIVYEVSCLIAEKGLMPILYTDGDYDASNECYKGIGYIERGRLCSITRK
jgi:predicted GNAT family acetyltransferase